MKPTHSVVRVAVALLSLAPAVSASWPGFLPALDSLVVRQEDSTSPSSPSPTPSPTPDDGEGDARTTSTGKKPAITTNLNTGGKTQSGPTKTGSNSTRKAEPTFNILDPAGGVVMITPGVHDGYPLYKLGDHITWGWNYTDLQGTPTAIDLLASCSCKGAHKTWTITSNMTFATPASYTWDTAQFQQEHAEDPLPMEEYKLVIHDAESSISAAPEPGYLAPFASFTFGLYKPKDPTPQSQWQCVTCSGAISDMERRVLGGAVAMSIITVLSFTWFVGGFAALL